MTSPPRRLGAANRSLSESSGRAQITCSWVSLKIIKDFALPCRSLFPGNLAHLGANVDAAEVAGPRAYGLGRLVV